MTGEAAAGDNSWHGNHQWAEPLRCRAKAEEAIMSKYECDVCGYVYDPAVGDPDGGIAPGTAFEDIPDDWVCPICGATKDQFTVVG